MGSRVLTMVALAATALSLAVAVPADAGRRGGHGRGGVEYRWDRHRGHGYARGHQGWSSGVRHGWSHRGWGHRHGGHWGGWYGSSVIVYDAYPYWGWGRPFWGTVLGGITGGVLGSTIGDGAGRAAAIVGGTVIGSMVGSSVGRYMDDVDRVYLARSLEYSPSGQVTSWQNPDTRARYNVAPLRTFQRTDGRYCREYQTTAQVGGRGQQVYGTACRQPDGSWELVR